METDNLNFVKKFLQVFAKRIAKSAPAPKCQTCECNSDDNGISYMDCYPCSYPTAANIEYVSVLLIFIVKGHSGSSLSFCNSRAKTETEPK